MKDILIVFEPKDKTLGRRFLVSKNTLHKYITENNANKVLKIAENQTLNKSTIKFRKYGKINIYLK